MKNKILIMTMSVFYTMCLLGQNETARNYLDTQLAVLESIQALTVQEKQQFDNIFWEKWQEHEQKEIAFHEAMCETLTTEEHFKQYFKDDIDKRSWVIMNDDLIYFRQKQKLPESSITKIKPLLQQRSKETAYCEYRYFTDSQKRSDAIADVRNQYHDRISNVTIRNNSSGASHNLGLVLENREKLNLSQQQVDSIVVAAQAIRRLTKAGEITREKNNCWLYERKFIMEHLREEQVIEFLYIRNFDHAKKNAEKIWAEMKEYNISSEYDSISTTEEIIEYQLAKESIKYIYMDNAEELKELNNELYAEAYPEILKHLNVEKREKSSQGAGASHNLRLVLENRERLNLTQQQVDSILSAAQTIRRLSRAEEITKEKNNRWLYERKFIMEHLREEQVSDFLSIRNYDFAKNYAEKRWAEMKEYDITFEYDSINTVNEIIGYRLTQEKIKYIYMDDSEKQKELDNYIYTTSYPKALKHLRVEKRKKKNQEAEETEVLIF